MYVCFVLLVGWLDCEFMDGVDGLMNEDIHTSCQMDGVVETELGEEGRRNE